MWGVCVCGRKRKKKVQRFFLFSFFYQFFFIFSQSSDCLTAVRSGFLLRLPGEPQPAESAGDRPLSYAAANDAPAAASEELPLLPIP